MNRFTFKEKLHYTLRLAAAMCFIGHGIFGLITKSIWVNYFAVAGINKHWSYQLMPVIGSIDICLGIIILIKPYRMVLLWLVIWGMITALLRPLSGEPVAEFFERAGNFGAPLALLLLTGFKPFFKAISPFSSVKTDDIKNVSICLQIAAFLLIAGHGWLNLIGKNSLLVEYSKMGFSNSIEVAQLVGIFEVTAAFIVLFSVNKYLIAGLLVWKIISELFYPHYEVVEWIERGGSYGVLLALFYITNSKYAKRVYIQLIEKLKHV